MKMLIIAGLLVWYTQTLPSERDAQIKALTNQVNAAKAQVAPAFAKQASAVVAVTPKPVDQRTVEVEPKPQPFVPHRGGNSAPAPECQHRAPDQFGNLDYFSCL